MCDYRNTKYCKSLDGILDRKQKVKEQILADHPKATDMHNYVSNNAKKYKKDFMKAYNYKCAYCGVSIALINQTSFEIDHFINQKSDEFKSKKEAGTIENLVLACHDCNHSKSSLSIPNDTRENLNPDKPAIRSLFYRDDKFYISIEEEAKSQNDVLLFYNTLHLGSEMHRIDYLLMSMIGLQNEINKKGEKCDGLAEAINVLSQKRNLMNVK